MEVSGSKIEQRCRLPLDGKASHAYLHALIENNPIAVVVLDGTHAFQMCNTAFLKLFQYEIFELESCSIDTLISAPGLAEEARQATRNVMLGRQVRLKSRRRRRDGCLVNVKIIGVPLLIDGHVEGVFGLYQKVAAPVEIGIRPAEHHARQFLPGITFQAHSPLHPFVLLSQGFSLLEANLEMLGRLALDAGDETLQVLQQTRELATLCGDRLRSLEEHLAQVEAVGDFRKVAATSCTDLLPSHGMTEREIQIVKLLACGLSSKEVAGRLGIRTRTVETHRLNIYRKLHVRNVADLVVYAVRKGLLTCA